ncbi:class I SAM-dependent methyltransferase [Chloroflexota bacterium]
MLELLDPKLLDPIAYGQGILSDIRQYSLLPNNRIGWNYCMDYTWMAMKCGDLLNPNMKILDIGCGPGAIHGYLENKYNINIIGIDLHRWENDYVDIVGDFTNPDVRKAHNLSNLDVIISTSAFEHNSPEDHQQLVSICREALNPGGYLITTFSASWIKSRFFRLSEQWNLNRKMLENIYQEKFRRYDYWKVWVRWHTHKEISLTYKARYGKWSLFSPPFISAGAFVQI